MLHSEDKQVPADQNTTMETMERTEEIKKENVIVNADTKEMETDKQEGEPTQPSIVNLTEKVDGKQPTPSTVPPSKPAKRRITPMAID